MTVDEKLVLHVLAESTQFNTGLFVQNVSTKTSCSPIMECWAMEYTRSSNRMLKGQRGYIGNAFGTIGASSDVDVQRTGVKARSSLGLSERHHQPLSNNSGMTMKEYPQTELRSALGPAVNGTMVQ